MEDMFIAYRGNKVSDPVTLNFNGYLVFGKYENGQIFVNGTPYPVPAEVSNYYSGYGIKIEGKVSEIVINEDDSSITDGSISLTREGCMSLVSNESDAIGGYITHIDVTNRTFTIRNRVFQ
jgi:hypothetical protein